MKFKPVIAALVAAILWCGAAFGQATILPPGETCFQATAGINGMVGVLGSITGGSLYTSGTYGGVPLTGGSGSGATANITVSGGIVTQVTVLNPGIQYVVGDVLSASSANLGGTGSGFSVPVASTSINSSLAGGSVAFYIPNTQTFKQTWQNAGETVLNQNPVPLDQNGCAIIYGAGIYLMQVMDSLGNTVYTQLTASTSPQGIFWAGLAGGTGNAITITDSAFALQDGATIQFRALNANTGPATLTVSGGSPISIVLDTTSGPAALSGGEIDPFNMPIVSYDATNVEFHLVNPAVNTSGGGTTSSGLQPPQGYLNLVGQASGDIVQTGDVIGSGIIYYSPAIGNLIPIWNGSTFKSITFSEMTVTLTAAGSAANAIQDVCVFLNNGVPILVTAPQWSNAAAGGGARGSGAGSAQIIRQQGIWVNAVSIIGNNGLSSFTIPANQCTMVGSLYIDASAGQVSAYVTTGQSRKWGIWNFYNRLPLQLKVADPATSWTTASAGWRESNGSTTNFAAAFMGLPEENVSMSFSQSISFGNSSAATTANIGIGINSTTVLSGKAGQALNLTGAPNNGTAGDLSAITSMAPALGLNNANMIEQVPVGTTTNSTFFGTTAHMLMTLNWRG